VRALFIVLLKFQQGVSTKKAEMGEAPGEQMVEELECYVHYTRQVRSVNGQPHYDQTARCQRPSLHSS
jgi:hypothetical protein